jgi:hypothetical protein
MFEYKVFFSGFLSGVWAQAGKVETHAARMGLTRTTPAGGTEPSLLAAHHRSM